MKRIASFLALPAGDRLLLLKAFATLVAVRIALRVLTVDQLRALARRRTAGTKPIERIAWAVRVASRAMPGTTCLVPALALQRLLSAHGHSSELHIGVARNAGAFAAHAWLSCQGEILVGEGEHEGFARLIAWKPG